MAFKESDLATFDVTLYHMKRVRSTRVKWLVYELDVADKVKIKEIDLFKGEQFKQEFKAINKMGAIPTLTVKQKDSETSMVMTESSGICLWLADMVPEAGLKPDLCNAFGLGQYYRFITFAASTMDPLLWDIRMHEQLLSETMRSEQVATEARKNFLEKVVPTLEDVLNADDGVEFICEPYHKGFTAADVMVGYALLWSNMYGLLDDSATLLAYYRRVTQRKGFRGATADKAAL